MNKGFAALTLTISVAGTLLALIAISSISTAQFFDLTMKKVYREMNYHNAYSCIDQAILSLAHDYFLTISEPKFLADFECSILSITKEGDLRHIQTRGDYQKAYVYRQATVRLKTHTLEVVKIE